MEGSTQVGFSLMKSCQSNTLLHLDSGIFFSFLSLSLSFSLSFFLPIFQGERIFLYQLLICIHQTFQGFMRFRFFSSLRNENQECFSLLKSRLDSTTPLSPSLISMMMMMSKRKEKERENGKREREWKENKHNNTSHKERERERCASKENVNCMTHSDIELTHSHPSLLILSFLTHSLPLSSFGEERNYETRRRTSLSLGEKGREREWGSGEPSNKY